MRKRPVAENEGISIIEEQRKREELRTLRILGVFPDFHSSAYFRFIVMEMVLFSLYLCSESQIDS